ncbi:MAG: hypothetical protein DLM59_04125 [Pseudonocardiales bacterium]|nr:MAG: hypothetical protein DLM59_04125 [Pseudonocardiales bacterium]
MTEPNAPQDPSSAEQPGGYPPPPAPPPPGYGPPANQPAYSQQPPPGPAPQPFSPLVGRQLTSDETMWSMLGHLGGIVLGFIAPLIVMLAKGNESPYVRYHAVEALNFQITAAIAYVIAYILLVVTFGILFFVPFLVWVGVIIFSIMAGLAANKGETYKYPFALRLVK